MNKTISTSSLMIKATFFRPNGQVDHSYTFDMNDDTSRVRFAIECKHAYQRKGAKITTEAIYDGNP